jgi:hypothetical protein
LTLRITGYSAVSSILKALKKIEETSLAADAGDPRPPLGAHRLWSLRRRAGRKRATLIAAVLAAAFIAAAGFFILGRNSGSETDPGGDRTAGAPNAVRAKIADPAAPAPPAAGPRAAGPAAAPEPAAAPPAAVAPPPLPKRPAPQTPPARPSARPAPREAPEAPAGDRPAPPAAGGQPPRSADDGLSRLENSKLKVMAIAWYTDPAKRIAVINGSLVKEGESVEGYRVTRIRKDDVIVSDGSRSWRVEFGLKTPP